MPTPPHCPTRLAATRDPARAHAGARQLAPRRGAARAAPRPRWPELPPYDAWHATRDTLHAHTQVLGKLAPRSRRPSRSCSTPRCASPHAAGRRRPCRRPTARARSASRSICTPTRWLAEHSDGRVQRIPLTPDRPVGAVTRDVLAAVRVLAGPVELNLTPQETPWTTPLDEDDEHASFDTARVDAYFAAATRAALVLAELRAPYRGRSTPVNAWWGSFDLAVSLFSGKPAEPPGADFIMRNAMECGTDRGRLVAGRRALSPRGLLRLRAPGARPASRTRRSSPRRRTGTRRSASSSWTGTTSATARIRTPTPSPSRARPCCTPARSAAGTRRSRPAPRAIPPPVAEGAKRPPETTSTPAASAFDRLGTPTTNPPTTSPGRVLRRS